MEEETIIQSIGFAVIIAIILILTVDKLARKLQREKQSEQKQSIPNYQHFFPYQRKYLLTRNEYYFYTKLIPIADKYNLQILAKVRLADLVEIKSNLNYANSNVYFNKIKSKHIDFVLVDNMKVVMLIELDDSSHQYQNRMERDIFVDDVVQRCGYIIIHTYGDTNQIDYEASYYRNTYTEV